MIYMDQPEGFVQKGQEDKVCLLRKSLYGLKQSPHEWNHRLDEFMIREKYTRCQYDLCVYMKGSTFKVRVFLLLYVDDMLIASKSKEEINMQKDLLKAEFKIKVLGPARRILGMDIFRDRDAGKLVLLHERYFG